MMYAATTASLSDVDLLRGLLSLDEGAWNEFHRRYDRMVKTCVHRVLVRFSSIVPSDAVQEVRGSFYASLLANDLHKLRSFDMTRGNKLGSWVGLIAINAAWDYLRTASRRPNVDSLAVAEELHVGVDDLFERTASREHCERLSVIMRGLPRRDQEFVRLCFIEGYAPQEIADALSINIKSVYTRKHRLGRRLRDALHPVNEAVAAVAA
jgi:RNA polymerase sigma-70 factor (ECF subfamily)